jgi:hypothetical protein
MTTKRNSQSDWARFDGSFEGTQRRQILAGLALNPGERLRWLERRMTELLRLKGKAALQDRPAPDIPTS